MTVRAAMMRAVAIPVVSRVASRGFWQLYRAMLAFEASSREEQSRERVRRLHALLEHAARHVPLWRDTFGNKGIDPRRLRSEEAPAALRRLPVSTKEVYRRGYPHRTTSDGDRSTWRFLSSSGTVDRLTVVTDLRKRDYLAASLLRVNHRTVGRDLGVRNVEIPPQCCNVMCALPDTREGVRDLAVHLLKGIRTRTLRSPETVARLRGCFRQFVLPRRVLLPIDPLPYAELTRILDSRLATIAAARPAIIRALPVYLVWLADRAAQLGLSFPSLAAVLPWGGLVTPAMQARIEAGFGVPFRDVYGATELGEIGISCGRGSGLHVHEDLYEVEILDARGLPVPEGGLGHITVTDFTNRAMPMIRYQVGDVGRFLTDECGCGHPGRRLVVHGRAAETLTNAKTGATVTAYDLLEIFFADPSVLNFRVDQVGPAQYAATVVTRGEGQDLASLAGRLGERLGTAGPPAVRAAPFIRPEESGKYRFAHPLAR